jgi:Zinc-ribbon
MAKVVEAITDTKKPSNNSNNMHALAPTAPSECRQGSCVGSYSDDEAPGMKRRRFVGSVLTDEAIPDDTKQTLIQKLMQTAAAWDTWADEIQELPVPRDLQSKVDIQCQDCHASSVNLKWHFIGVQCPQCTSFDTTVVEKKRAKRARFV